MSSVVCTRGQMNVNVNVHLDALRARPPRRRGVHSHRFLSALRFSSGSVLRLCSRAEAAKLFKNLRRGGRAVLENDRRPGH